MKSLDSSHQLLFQLEGALEIASAAVSNRVFKGQEAVKIARNSVKNT